MNVSALFWDQLARNFDNREQPVESIRNRAAAQTKKQLHGDEVLLDFGCGTGTLAVELAGSVKAIHGIDISSNMIAAARRKAAAHQLANVEFRQMSLFDDQLQPASFEVVMATGILHLIKHPQQAVRRISELLKPGGWFVSTTPCIGEQGTAATLINRLLFLPGQIGLLPYLRFLRIDELERTITQARFQIVERETLTFGAQHAERYVIARLLVARK
jgi:2-polyprenyl-3-methyl-5-hydroxy-6-metoxy-1,4-benzoquinol methylase